MLVRKKASPNRKKKSPVTSGRKPAMQVASFSKPVEKLVRDRFDEPVDLRRVIAALFGSVLDSEISDERRQDIESWLIAEGKRLENEGEAPDFQGMARRFVQRLLDSLPPE